ncbi:hypothetical protein TNCV_4495281 [Trichonephila clavipes]|nr:hypothetical protein TNCV_4495281 [Trichonephila clavipes]
MEDNEHLLTKFLNSTKEAAYRDCRFLPEKLINVLDETKKLYDVDLSSLDARGNDGLTGLITPTMLHHCP